MVASLTTAMNEQCASLRNSHNIVNHCSSVCLGGGVDIDTWLPSCPYLVYERASTIQKELEWKG